jgi:hypothetical protein
VARWLLVPVAVVALPGLLGCQGASGCEDFHPRSSALPTGASTPVTAVVHEGGVLDPLDVDGGYHPSAADTASPDAGSPRRVRTRPGRYEVEVSHDREGLVLHLPGETVPLGAAIGCD